MAGTGWHDHRRKQPTERPMPQPNDLSRSPIALNQDGTLIAVIEMSRSSWLVAGIVPGIARHPLKKLAADAAVLSGFAPLPLADEGGSVASLRGGFGLDRRAVSTRQVAARVSWRRAKSSTRISQVAALGTAHRRPPDESAAAACQGLPRYQSTSRARMTLEALDACRPGFLAIPNVVSAARPSR